MTKQFSLDTAHPLSVVRSLPAVLAIPMFAALTAAGAQIAIPVLPVPFTLQTMFVLLSGAFLGARKGAAAQALYLAAGAMGLPVFAGFTGTAFHLAGPTGGYLLAFPAAAFITGAFVDASKGLRRIPLSFRTIAGMALALAVVFAMGVSWLNVFYIHNWQTSLIAGFSTLQLWDAVKLSAAAGIYLAARKGLGK
jgi:biotin transport system substrate-specific component